MQYLYDVPIIDTTFKTCFMRYQQEISNLFKTYSKNSYVIFNFFLFIKPKLKPTLPNPKIQF